jgi:hypothetical protein
MFSLQVAILFVFLPYWDVEAGESSRLGAGRFR